MPWLGGCTLVSVLYGNFARDRSAFTSLHRIVVYCSERDTRC